MQLQLPFGEGTIDAELPQRTVILRGDGAARLTAVDDLEAEVRRALDTPLGCAPLESLVRPGARVTIAFDDPTVMSFNPLRRVAITQMLDRLTSAGVDRQTVKLICANSLHRKFRPAELAGMLGQDLVDEFGDRLFCHDAEDPQQLVDLGQTPSGYDVELSRHAVESDLLVYINAAHNRGFCGGWKSVCVGLSTYRSIRHHHTPDGMSMSLANNRMHRVLDEMGALVESRLTTRIFKIDTLVSNPFQVAHVYAGTVAATRQAAIERLSQVQPPRRSLDAQPFDILVYGVPGWSPYAIGASMNPLLTLVSSGLGYLGGTVQALGAPGASLIMATPCPDEWDRVHHPSYPDVWQHVLTRTRDPYQIAREFADAYIHHPAYIEQYRHGYAFHPVHAILATYPLVRLKHVGRVYVAGATQPKLITHLGFIPTATVEEAITLAERNHGADCRIGYVPQPVVPTKLLM